MSVSRRNLPKKWDVVEAVKFSKDGKLAQICFNTGSKIVVQLSVGEKEAVKGVNENVLIPRTVKEKRPMTQAEKDVDYKNRALRALENLGGPTGEKPLTVIEETVKGEDPISSYQPPPNFEELKERALAASLARSERIAKEIAPPTPMGMK